MTLSQASVDALFDAALPPEPPSPDRRGSAARTPPSESTPPVSGNQPRPDEADVRRILGLSVPVTAVLAKRDMTIESILDIAAGTIIEFDVLFDSDLTLHVANRPIGSGQAVKVGENFGLRVTRIEAVRDRIDALGGH